MEENVKQIKQKLNIDKVMEYTTPYAECVTSTYGPNGANVLLKTNGEQIITKDGVTVSQALMYDDPIQQALVDVLKEAARETVTKVGDGTTSTVIVSYSLLSQFSMEPHYNELKTKKVIDRFSNEFKKVIQEFGKSYKTKAEDIKNIIFISTNGDKQLTDCIYDAVMYTGVGGKLILRDSNTQETTVEFREGYEMPSGYFGPSFANDKAADKVRYEDPLILVTDLILEDAKELQRVVAFADRAKRPVIVIADDVRGDALAFAALNAQVGAPLALLKAPSYGFNRKELMEDLCSSIGATFINSLTYTSLERVRLTDLGTCRRIEADPKKTMFIECAGDTDSLMKRIEQLKARLGTTTDENEIERLQDRLARLAASVAIIYVGGLNPTERTERKHRIDDAVECVKSIERYGVAPGAGMFYHWLAYHKLDGMKEEVLKETPIEQHPIVEKCCKAIYESLLTPAETLMHMASLEKHAGDYRKESEKYSKINTDGKFMGVNYETGEHVDLYKEGIVEPAELSLNVICNSLSAAGILMTVKYIVL